MLKTLLIAAAIAPLAFAQPAAAAVPVLSGKYIAHFQLYCRSHIHATYANTPTGSVVTGVSPGTDGDGDYFSGAVVANFDPGTATLTLKGVGNDMSATILSDSLGDVNQHFTNPFNVNFAWAYSNTDATVTADGVVYNAVFGSLKKGITQSGVMTGVDSSNCSRTMTFSK